MDQKKFMGGLEKLTFVLGGAASGKSSYAESIVAASRKRKVYLATAQAFDDEMRQKIADHRTQRGAGWQTIEAPIDVAGALATVDADAVVLLDCATLWLSNLVLAERDVAAETEKLLATVAATDAPVVIVSNEVGQGVVPETRLGRDFRNQQGRLNQRLAAEAQTVVHVIAGIPRALKGVLP